MNILISGASGFVGTPLIKKLEAKGHTIYKLSRSKSGQSNMFHWNPGENIIELDDSVQFDAVIHLAGEGIANKRWSAAQKEKIRESRSKGTRLLSEKIAQLNHRPSVMVSASAIGFYGDRGDEVLTENSPPGNSFLPEVCQIWEQATEPASEAGIRVVNTRIGIVLGKGGGALQKMLLPFKMGVGGIIGDGKQYWSWIALDELTEIICFAIENEQVSGPINCVSPQPVTNREFTKILGQALHRPTIFPMPAFAAKMALGEMADALLLCSAKVLPEKLEEAQYTFKYPELENALEHILA